MMHIIHYFLNSIIFTEHLLYAKKFVLDVARGTENINTQLLHKR